MYANGVTWSRVLHVGHYIRDCSCVNSVVKLKLVSTFEINLSFIIYTFIIYTFITHGNFGFYLFL